MRLVFKITIFSFLRSDEGKTKGGNLVLQTEFYQKPFILLQTLSTLSFSIFTIFTSCIQIPKGNNLSFPSVSEAKQASEGMAFNTDGSLLLLPSIYGLHTLAHVMPCYYTCHLKLMSLLHYRWKMSKIVFCPQISRSDSPTTFFYSLSASGIWSSLPGSQVISFSFC